MKKKKYILFLGIIMTLNFISCSDDFLNEEPEHIYTADRLYTSLDGYEKGLNGLYAEVRKEFEGLGYTNNFGTVDLRNVLYMLGTDNMATGSNKGNVHKMLNSWGVANHPSYKDFDKYFLWFYETVNAANTIINRAIVSDINWNDKNGVNQYYRILAEAKVFRAWAYRHLSYLWGAVPIVTTETTDNIHTDFVREPVEKVRRFIIEDLEFAAEYLPWTANKTGTMTKGVAMTWLSEMYMALGDEDKAYMWADKRITGGPYAIQMSKQSTDKSVFMGMFQPQNINNSNPEILWSLNWARGIVGGGENIMRHESTLRYGDNRPKWKGADGLNLAYTEARGGRGWHRMNITKDALLLYYESSKDPNPVHKQIDERGNEFAIGQYFVLTDADKLTDNAGNDIMNTTLKRPWAPGDTVWLSAKKDASDKMTSAFDYNNLSDTKPVSNNAPYSLKFAFCDAGYTENTESHFSQIYMRLAETLLLRAEAAIRRGMPGLAVADINVLRNRANAKLITVDDLGSSLEEQLNFILDERSRELLLEEQRRYTLLRMGGEKFMYPRITERNLIDGTNFTLRDTIFPIPQTVIDANRTLYMPQNPGYAASTDEK